MKKNLQEAFPEKYQLIFANINTDQPSIEDLLILGRESAEIEEIRQIVLAVDSPQCHFGIAGNVGMPANFQIHFPSGRTTKRA